MNARLHAQFIALFTFAVLSLLGTNRILASGAFPENNSFDCRNATPGCDPVPECVPCEEAQCNSGGTGSGGGGGGGGAGPGTGSDGKGGSGSGDSCYGACGRGQSGGAGGHNTDSSANELPGATSTPGYGPTTDFPIGLQGKNYKSSSSYERGSVHAGKLQLDLRRTDMALFKSASMPLAPSRTYNNATWQYTRNEEGYTYLGPRWHFNYDMHLEASGGAKDVILRTSSGGQVILYNVDNDTWRGNAFNGGSCELRQVSASVYTLHQPDPSIVYTFNTTGSLTQIRTHNGHTQDLTYDENNVLTTIELNHENPLLDTDDRYVTFHYADYTTFTELSSPGPHKRLVRMTSSEGNSVMYEYDGYGMLAGVKDDSGVWLEEYWNRKSPQQFENTDVAQIASVQGPIADDGTTIIKAIYIYGGDYCVSRGYADKMEHKLIQIEADLSFSNYIRNVHTGQFHKQYKLNINRDPVSTKIKGAVDGMTYVERSQEFVAGTLTNYGNPGYDTPGLYRDSISPRHRISDSGTTTTYEYLNESSSTGPGWDKTFVNKVTEANGDETEFEYDENYRLKTVIRPGGRITQYTHDAEGNKTSMTDPMGNTWYYFYDALGRLEMTEDPTSGTTMIEYDTLGRVSVTTNTEGRAINYTYNASGKVETVSALQTTVTYEYDLKERLTTTTDHLGNSKVDEYDKWGRQVSVTDPSGNKTRYSYTTSGTLQNIIYADDSWTTYSYDPWDRMTTFTDQRGKTTSYGFDILDRKIWEKTPLNKTTSYEYHSGGCQSCGSAGAGHMASVTDPAGRTTYFNYDPLSGRIIKQWFSGSSDIVYYEYDVAGRVSATGDSRVPSADIGGTTFTLQYDLNDRLTTYTWPNGWTVTYGYDSLGRRTSMTDPDGNVTEYYYANVADNKKRLLKRIRG